MVHYSNFSLHIFYIASVAAAEIAIFLSNWGELTIRGVNRHEHDPRNGHVVDRESMIKVAWLDSRSFGAEDFADVNVFLRTSDSFTYHAAKWIRSISILQWFSNIKAVKRNGGVFFFPFSNSTDEDIQLMKQNNFNAVRCAHYPLLGRSCPGHWLLAGEQRPNHAEGHLLFGLPSGNLT